MASSPTINAWNEHWRTTPEYAQILRSIGVDPSRPFKLTDNQRRAVKAQAEKAFGFTFPKGTEIDAAGNMNEDEGFGKQLKKWGPIAAAGALAAFGIPGLLPGLLTGGGAAAGGAAATGAAFDAAPNIATAAGLHGAGLVAASHTPSWLIPAITTGAQSVTGLIGARVQSNAERDAARIQADYLNRALDVEKENEAYRRRIDEEREGYRRGQRADYLGRLQPYNEAGTAAVGRASNLLTTGYRPELGTAQGGPTVRLKAPDGSIGEVPASLVDHYISRGATRV